MGDTRNSLLVSFSEAAKLLGVSRSTLYSMHSNGTLGLLPLKIGRRVLLNRKELEVWVDSGMPVRERWQMIRGRK